MSRKESGTIRHSREKGNKALPGKKSNPSPPNERRRQAENSIPDKTRVTQEFQKMSLAETGKLVRDLQIHFSEHSKTEDALRESESRYREISDQLAKADKTLRKLENTLESISDGFFTLDKEWRFTYLNREAVRLWKMPYEDLIGKSMWDVSPKEIGTIFDRQYNRAVNEKTPVSFEALFPLHNIWIEVRAYPSEDGLSVYFLDIDKKKQGETRVRATNDLLKLFSGASSRKDYLDSVAKLIKGWTGCCCVGVGILDKEGNIPYESSTGFNDEFGEPENVISIKHLQSACLNIMLGEKTTHRMSDMTPFGSFRSNNTFAFVKKLSETDRARFRALCIRTGFKSMAIIPVRHKDSVVGAIHLADKKEGMVPLERVKFIESISTLLGEAIHRFNLDEEMHENYFNQAAINMVLSTSLEDIPLDMFLNKTLTIILSVPWLSSESSGCIHLVENNPDMLTMRAQHNLPEALKESCAYVPFGRCTCGQAALTQQTQFVDHINNQHDICGEVSPHGHYAAPIVFGGRTLGVINIYLGEWHIRDRKEEDFLETVANTLAGIIVRKQSENLLKKSQERLSDSREKLRHLNAHLQSVREKERTEIAREIHDEFGTILTALKIDLSWLEKKLPQEQPLLAEKTKNSLDLINAAIKAVQRISSELRPGILDHLGLASAVEWHVKEFGLRTGIACDISVDMDNAEMDRDLSTTIFRILQEALTNIARHSEATEVSVGLREKEGILSLSVADNGKGILEEQLSAHDSFGLMGIKERVKHWSGDLTIRGIHNKGTTIEVHIPIENKERNR